MFSLPFFKMIVLGAATLMKVSTCTTRSSCSHLLNQMITHHITEHCTFIPCAQTFCCFILQKFQSLPSCIVASIPGCFTYAMSNLKWLYSLQQDGYGSEDSLDVENTLWANCVVASGSALGVVVYTGSETRSVMNNSQPRSKVGLLDLEINQLTKVWGFSSNIQLWCANVWILFML